MSPISRITDAVADLVVLSTFCAAAYGTDYLKHHIELEKLQYATLYQLSWEPSLFRSSTWGSFFGIGRPCTT
jgi:hypothetical protein